MKTWKAPGDMVIAAIIPEDKVTASGIHIPSGRVAVKRGTVLAVGPDVKGVAVGYEVRFLSGRDVEVTPGIVAVSVGYVLVGIETTEESDVSYGN